MPKMEAPPSAGAAASGIVSCDGDGPEDGDDIAQSQPRLHLIRVCCGGTYDFISDPEPGAIEARLLRVHDLDGDLVDVIAWAPTKPTTWWTKRGLVTHVGTDALSRSAWLGKPAYFVETPQRFLECDKRVACIINWQADINSIIGEAEAVICETPALARRMRETILAQCRPAIVDRITAHRRAA